tara:strand:+ start:792 stop:1610 length:819 start_codon:yes stop_codon:yes gene_type:complete
MTQNYNYSKDELLSIFDDITMISINNNLFIKNKVKKKIELIKRISKNDIDILNYNNKKKEGLFHYLNSLTIKFTTVKKNYNKLNNKLNTILGEIIHNAYLTSGYQVLISNIPELGIQLYNNNNIVIVDEEAIYDTINYYIKTINGVLSVVKIDTNTYLAKLKDINDARYLCGIIHKMQIETNIIRVEMLENLENCFNDEQITLEKNKNNNSDSNSSNSSNNSDTISDIDDIDISDYGYNTINIKNKSKTLIETYLKLIYSKINYVLSYFWKK